MNYKNVVAAILLASVTYGYGQADEAATRVDSHVVSNELLTQKLRDEFNSCVESIKQHYGLETYETFFDRLVVNDSYPILIAMIRELAAQMQIDVPQVFIYKGTVNSRQQDALSGNGSICNAIAIKQSAAEKPIIIIGMELFTHPKYALTYNELHAILAHECAHIKENHLDKIMAINQIKLGLSAAMLSSLGFLYGTSEVDKLFERYNIENKQYASFITKYRLLKYGIYWGVGNSITVLVNAISNALSRSREKEADMRALTTGIDANALISGIEKIERMSERLDGMLLGVIRKIKTFFRTHPLTPDRERYLQLMNDEQK